MTADPGYPLSLIFLFHRALPSDNSIGYWRRWSRRASMRRRSVSRVWGPGRSRKTCAIELRRRSLLDRDFVFDSESSAHCPPCEARATRREYDRNKEVVDSALLIDLKWSRGCCRRCRSSESLAKQLVEVIRPEPLNPPSAEDADL